MTNILKKYVRKSFSEKITREAKTIAWKFKGGVIHNSVITGFHRSNKKRLQGVEVKKRWDGYNLHERVLFYLKKRFIYQLHAFYYLIIERFWAFSLSIINPNSDYIPILLESAWNTSPNSLRLFWLHNWRLYSLNLENYESLSISC